VPKEQIEHWIDEPFETPHYPSEADMHKCGCVEWTGSGEGGDEYELRGGLTLGNVTSTGGIGAESLSAERLTLSELATTSEVYLELEEATYNAGVPGTPSSGIRLYCDGGELWIIRAGGSTTQLS
jgi:hypothetical protein